MNTSVFCLFFCFFSLWSEITANLRLHFTLPWSAPFEHTHLDIQRSTFLHAADDIRLQLNFIVFYSYSYWQGATVRSFQRTLTLTDIWINEEDFLFSLFLSLSIFTSFKRRWRCWNRSTCIFRRLHWSISIGKMWSIHDQQTKMKTTTTTKMTMTATGWREVTVKQASQSTRLCLD